MEAVAGDATPPLQRCGTGAPGAMLGPCGPTAPDGAGRTCAMTRACNKLLREQQCAMPVELEATDTTAGGVALKVGTGLRALVALWQRATVIMHTDAAMPPGLGVSLRGAMHASLATAQGSAVATGRCGAALIGDEGLRERPCECPWRVPRPWGARGDTLLPLHSGGAKLHDGPRPTQRKW